VGSRRELLVVKADESVPFSLLLTSRSRFGARVAGEEIL
jgi:hypothetical protein